MPATTMVPQRESVVWLDTKKKRRRLTPHEWPIISRPRQEIEAPSVEIPDRPPLRRPCLREHRRNSFRSSIPTEYLPRTPPTPGSTTAFGVHRLGMSPLPWIDLASDSGSRRGSIGSDRPVSSVSSQTVILGTAAGYETASVPYHEREGTFGRDAFAPNDWPEEKEEKDGDDGEERVYPTGLRFWLIFLSMVLSAIPSSLDRTILSTAIPQITNDFNSLTDASWYGSVYLLFATAFQPTFGKMYQIFNVKFTFLFAMSTFLIGSLVCGLAPNSTVFILGRALSGLGSGGVVSGSLTVMAYAVRPEKRPVFSGILGAVFGIFMFLGTVVGGAITQSKLSWRWCFYINLPMGGIALLGVIFLLQDAKALQTDKTFLQKVKELDYIGPMLFIPAIIIMLIVLQFGGSTYAWVSVGTLSLIGAFLILIGIWLYTQYRLGDRATVPFAVLFQRTVFSASWFGYFSLGAFSLMAFYGPYYFQAINGSSALQSGIRALPLILTATVFSVIAGLWISMLGCYTPIMIGGTALLIIATGLLTTLTSTTPYVKIAGLMALAGVGIGMNFQTAIVAVQTVVNEREVPIATSLVIFFTTLGAGMTVGIAQSIIENHLYPAMLVIDPEITIPDIVRAGVTGLKDLVPPADLPAVLEAYAKSIDMGVFGPAAVYAGMAFLIALRIEWRSVKSKGKGKKEKDKNAEAEEEEPQGRVSYI